MLCVCVYVCAYMYLLGMYRYRYLIIYRYSDISMVLKPITDVLDPSISNLKHYVSISQWYACSHVQSQYVLAILLDEN